MTRLFESCQFLEIFLPLWCNTFHRVQKSKMPAHFDMDYAPSTAIIPANKKGVNVAADCWLHSLVISNFKSYRGRHVIGPFKHLTGVIGPNGAGTKSSLSSLTTFPLNVCVQVNPIYSTLSLLSLGYKLAKCEVLRLTV